MSDSTTTLKQCTKKDQCVHPERIGDGWLPATTDYFYWRNDNNKLSNTCKYCQRKRSRKWHWDNRDQALSRMFQWNIEHAGRHRRSSQKWYQENKIRCNQNKLKWRNKNREKLTRYGRKWRTDHTERSRQFSRDYYNRDIETKREQANIRTIKRRSAKRNLAYDFSSEAWANALDYWDNSCCYCGEKHPKLERDHFIPISDIASKGTTNDNIVPACSSCNRSKRNRHPVIWAIDKFGIDDASQIIQEIFIYLISVRVKQS